MAITKYRYVYYSLDDHRYPGKPYKAQICINNKHYHQRYDDIKQAAKAIDLILIQNNRHPINILIKKP